MDRLRRLLPLPLLAVSTAAALVAPSAGGGWTARDTALVAAAAVWSAVITARLRPDASPRWRLVTFAVHTALAGLLVGVDTWFGLFAYCGFLFAYGLGPRWRIPAFAVTALIVSGAMAGGYPTGAGDDLLSYLLVAAVLLAVVINSASITYRALEQNLERGRMIGELAEANRRLEAALAENAGLHAQLLDPGPGGRRARRAAADGRGDPRHPGPGADRRSSPSSRRPSRPGDRPDGGAGTSTQARTLARESLTEARRSVQALRPEPLDGAPLPEALGERGRRLVGSCTAIAGRARRPPATAAAAPGDRGRAAADRAGGAGQRGQARAGDPGRADTVLHGGRGDAGRRATTAWASTRPAGRDGGAGSAWSAMRQRVRARRRDAGGRVRARRRHGDLGAAVPAMRAGGGRA